MKLKWVLYCELLARLGLKSDMIIYALPDGAAVTVTAHPVSSFSEILRLEALPFGLKALEDEYFCAMFYLELNK